MSGLHGKFAVKSYNPLRTEDPQVPTYIDIHDLPSGVTAEEIAKAHYADEQVQDKHRVKYHKYWVNRKSGKLFCMCDAPSAEAAAAVHQEAHGLTALKILEVTPEIADAFMGASEVDNGGAVLLPQSREHDRARAQCFLPISSDRRA